LLFQEFDSEQQTNRFKQGVPSPAGDAEAQALDEADIHLARLSGSGSCCA
jgi:hypothetical protein